MRRLIVPAATVLSLATAVVVMPWVRAQAPPTITVDVAAGRRSIDPRIYGVTFASRPELVALNVPLNRSGGNATTRHNWQLNADNRAQRLVLREPRRRQRDAGRSDGLLRVGHAGRRARSPC